MAPTTETIRITGTPKGQPRVRACIRGRRAGVYTPATADVWHALVTLAVRCHMQQQHACTALPIYTGPLAVSTQFVFVRPKSHFYSNGQLKPNAPHWHTSKPDRDNLDKLILDVLTSQGLCRDDAQVCAGEPTKRYAALGEAPGAVITIHSLLPTPARTIAE